MKTKILILIAIIFVGFFSSCNKPEKSISKRELVNLIETDQVKQIDIVNRQHVLIILKEVVDKPKLKMQIGSVASFEKAIGEIARKHNVTITYFSKTSASGFLFPFMFPLILLVGIFLYFIGGVICLFITMKNEFINSHDKIAWVITIIFAPVIGVLLFIILGRRQIKTFHNKN